MSEYTKTLNEYPNMVFMDTASRRNKETSLVQIETANIIPSNYFVDNVKQYKKVYTWNSKLCREYKNIGIDVVQLPNFPLFDNYSNLESFIPFEDRIDGICLICRFSVKSVDFDLVGKRIEVFESFQNITKHTYGKIPYLDLYYKGVIGSETHETYPSSLAKLKKLNEYKFNLCFENAYHELWSWDYVTEKITDCFKSKTVGVYYGCYNIEERIPPELYVDYRKFPSDSALEDYLKNMGKDEFEDMTEKAFEWMKENDIGNIKEFKEILDND